MDTADCPPVVIMGFKSASAAVPRSQQQRPAGLLLIKKTPSLLSLQLARGPEEDDHAYHDDDSDFYSEDEDDCYSDADADPQLTECGSADFGAGARSSAGSSSAGSSGSQGAASAPLTPRSRPIAIPARSPLDWRWRVAAARAAAVRAAAAAQRQQAAAAAAAAQQRQPAANKAASARRPPLSGRA